MLQCLVSASGDLFDLQTVELLGTKVVSFSNLPPEIALSLRTLTEMCSHCILPLQSNTQEFNTQRGYV